MLYIKLWNYDKEYFQNVLLIMLKPLMFQKCHMRKQERSPLGEYGADMIQATSCDFGIVGDARMTTSLRPGETKG